MTISWKNSKLAHKDVLYLLNLKAEILQVAHRCGIIVGEYREKSLEQESKKKTNVGLSPHVTLGLEVKPRQHQ